MIDESEVVGEIKRWRRATAWTVQKDRWERKEQRHWPSAAIKRASSLDIKIVRCEYSFDGGRLLVISRPSSAPTFAHLVRTGAHSPRIDAKLTSRQAKLLDGVGKVQAVLHKLAAQFTPVSIRMAKNQQLPLNPDEIRCAGGCLLSLVRKPLLRKQNKKMPKMGAEVITPQGVGRAATFIRSKNGYRSSYRVRCW